MEIKLPGHFEVIYEDENQKYYSEPYKSQIKKQLLDVSLGYCMYCGKRIIVDGCDFSHVEHSVDKKGNISQNDEDFLEHCKYNLAVACPKCNLVYKKRIDKISIRKYKGKICDAECKKECKDYMEIKKMYQDRNQMYLAPKGYKKGNSYVSISYDLLNTRFVPSSEICDDPEMSFFANNQIERFALNEEMYSFCVTEICELLIQLIDAGATNIEYIIHILKTIHFDNIVGTKFVEYLSNVNQNNKSMSVKKLKDLCEMILLLDMVAI